MSTVTAYVLDTRTGVEAPTPLGSYAEALGAPCLTIGSDPRCSVVLADPDVAPVAATFRARGHHLYFARLKEGATFPVEVEAVPYRRLRFGYDHAEEPLTIGPYVVRLSFARKSPA